MRSPVVYLVLGVAAAGTVAAGGSMGASECYLECNKYCPAPECPSCEYDTPKCPPTPKCDKPECPSCEPCYKETVTVSVPHYTTVTCTETVTEHTTDYIHDTLETTVTYDNIIHKTDTVEIASPTTIIEKETETDIAYVTKTIFETAVVATSYPVYVTIDETSILTSFVTHFSTFVVTVSSEVKVEVPVTVPTTVKVPTTVEVPTTVVEIAPCVSVTDTPITKVTLCPIPTNPPGLDVSYDPLDDLTWGCKPGYVCYPPKIDCNLFPDSPADDYVCPEYDCIRAPPTHDTPWPENGTDFYEQQRGYFNLDPLLFGLSYEIFEIPEIITTEFCGTTTVYTTGNYESQTCLTHYPPAPTDITACPPPLVTPTCTTTDCPTPTPPPPPPPPTSTPCTTDDYVPPPPPPPHKPEVPEYPAPTPKYEKDHQKEEGGWGGHDSGYDGGSGYGEHKHPYRALVKRGDDSILPSVCYDDCNDCYTESQKVGKSDALCKEGSVFLGAHAACLDCISTWASQTVDTGRETLDNKFEQFIHFCDNPAGTSTEDGSGSGQEEQSGDGVETDTTDQTPSETGEPEVIDGSGSGDGSDSGSGDGSTDGSGAGSGDGSDGGTGDGSSDGSSDGSGGGTDGGAGGLSGDGSDDGSGSESGSDSGSDSGSGSATGGSTSTDDTSTPTETETPTDTGSSTTGPAPVDTSSGGRQTAPAFISLFGPLLALFLFSF